MESPDFVGFLHFKGFPHKLNVQEMNQLFEKKEKTMASETDGPSNIASQLVCLQASIERCFEEMSSLKERLTSFCLPPPPANPQAVSGVPVVIKQLGSQLGTRLYECNEKLRILAQDIVALRDAID